MQTILKSSIFDQKTKTQNFSQNFETQILKEKTDTIDQDGVRGTIKEIQLDGIFLSMRDVEVDSCYEIEVSHDFPLFKLHFEMEGSNLYTPSNISSDSLFIPNGHYNLFYLPEVNGTLRYETRHRRTLEIMFTEHYVQRIIGQDYEDTLQDFGKAIADEKPYVMWENSKPISGELRACLQEIITCEYKGKIKKAYLEAKVMELLVIILEKTNTASCGEVVARLSKQDYSNMLDVEAFIIQNLKKQLTISDLAAVAGVNTSKLKHDFKKVFSTTIFKYVTTLRMEKARSLILENYLSVTQASYEVGYKNPQHFTVAFKKKYGVLPSGLKRL